MSGTCDDHHIDGGQHDFFRAKGQITARKVCVDGRKLSECHRIGLIDSAMYIHQALHSSQGRYIDSKA